MTRAASIRTWHAGLHALCSLAQADGSTRAVTDAMKEAAEQVGNTPAVAKNA